MITQSSLTPDNSDVTGAIRKGTSSNSAQSGTTVSLCVFSWPCVSLNYCVIRYSCRLN
jgi:hypothetical protein